MINCSVWQLKLKKLVIYHLFVRIWGTTQLWLPCKGQLYIVYETNCSQQMHSYVLLSWQRCVFGVRHVRCLLPFSPFLVGRPWKKFLFILEISRDRCYMVHRVMKMAFHLQKRIYRHDINTRVGSLRWSLTDDLAWKISQVDLAEKFRSAVKCTMQMVLI